MFFWIRDPRSEIRDPGWEKTRIRDKHPGSATLVGAKHRPGIGQPKGYVDTIEAANMPESYRYWFWHGGNKLKADVQEWTSLDRIKQSQVSGTPRAGGSFRSSMGQPYVLFSDLK